MINSDLIISKKNFFLWIFFLRFQNLYEILNIWQKKMTLIPHVFPEIQAPKNMVR